MVQVRLAQTLAAKRVDQALGYRLKLHSETVSKEMPQHKRRKRSNW